MIRSSKFQAMVRRLAILIVWIVCLGANVLATGLVSARAEPFKPTGDSTVLARLSVSGDQTLKALRDRWKADPDNTVAALALARQYLRLERTEGDPRYLGYAQAVLAPWWQKKNISSDISIVRAHLLARRHKFNAAMADLESVLRRNPRHPQALLSRAFILQSQGKAVRALADCRRLDTAARSLASQTCLARMESLRGSGALADARLTKAMSDYTNSGREARLWALTNLAEIVWRRGDRGRAERIFEEAMALDRRDSYLLNAYADLLLDQERYGDVIGLLAKRSPSDGHLLRLALAMRGHKKETASSMIDTLAARFDANRRRGEALHLREEARFELGLKRRPDRALSLALENWRSQREPADARLVLQSALAAGEPSKSRPVLDWLDRTGLDDQALRPLVAKLKGKI